MMSTAREKRRPLSGMPIALEGGATLVPFFSGTFPEAEGCVLIFPGGGYGHLSGQEGEGYAQQLAAWGVHAFVLNYRLPAEGQIHPAPLQDARLAVRLLRARAKDWGLSRKKIAAMGSSAGGHLLGTLLTVELDDASRGGGELANLSARPDAAIFCYPVISMLDLPHEASRDRLIPRAEHPELERLSVERNIPDHCPPCFIWHTAEDVAVPVEHSLMLATALRRKKISFELHVFESGSHGLGIRGHHPWDSLLRAWLTRQGWFPERKL